MKIIGVNLLSFQIDQEPTQSFKAILNEAGMIIFPESTQHASIKQLGISYEDEYKGDALAAVLDGTKCEIRWHRDFTPERVEAIWRAILKHPDTSPLIGLRVSYQGRVLYP